MEGQVFVPYNGIGGVNMCGDFMTMDAFGSTVPPGTGSPGMMNVRWIYPGGIISKTYDGQGLWGYLLIPYSGGGKLTFDADVEKYLSENNITDISKIIEELNKLVSDYVTRVMEYIPPEGQEGELGYVAFQRTFEGCWNIVH